MSKNLVASHSVEIAKVRANITMYSIRDMIYEYRVFRETIFECLERKWELNAAKLRSIFRAFEFALEHAANIDLIFRLDFSLNS